MRTSVSFGIFTRSLNFATSHVLGLISILTIIAGVFTGSARAQVALTCLDTNPMTGVPETEPTPGPNDISQLTISYIPSFPDKFNYYSNNGAQNGACPGQTFTTGANAGGYTLNSVALATSGGNSFYNPSFEVVQPYVLNIYLLNGNTATLVQSFYVPAFTFVDGYPNGNGAWLQWTGLNMPLLSGKTYAYTFGNTLLGTGYFELGTQNGNPYAGGQICIIPNAGGTVTYESQTGYDAAFDIGLSLGSSAQPPVFYAQPAPKMLYPGGTARFSAAVAGNAPISYQWQSNGVSLVDGGRITGSHTNALAIANVNAADAANYTLVASNSVLVATSSVAPLTIVSAPSAGSYAAAVAAQHPVAYWRFNETANPANNPPAFDFVGGLDGTYVDQAVDDVATLQPPSFTGLEANNTGFQSNNHQYQSEVVIPALNLNTNAVTITAWIYPNVPQYNYEGLVFWRLNSDAGGMGYGTNNYLGYTWNMNAANTWGFSSGLSVPSNMWSLVAVTISPTNAILYVFNANGAASATNSITHINEPFSTAGTVADDPVAEGRIFSGDLDEVAVFNHTLRGPDLATLYNTAVSGSVAPPAVTITYQVIGASLQLTWSTGTLLQASSPTGPWTTNPATSPYLLSPTAPQAFYRVIIQ